MGKLMMVAAGMMLPLHGGTYSGTLKTKHAMALADITLMATKQGTAEVVSFKTARAGEFSAELSDGTWTIAADPAALEKLGLAPFPNASVTMSGGAAQSSNLVLHATEPLRTPRMDFSLAADRRLTFLVEGQAGTRVTIYSSTDLKTWSSYYSKGITTGYMYSHRAVGPPFPAKRYFKAVATID